MLTPQRGHRPNMYIIDIIAMHDMCHDSLANCLVLGRPCLPNFPRTQDSGVKAFLLHVLPRSHKNTFFSYKSEDMNQVSIYILYILLAAHGRSCTMLSSSEVSRRMASQAAFNSSSINLLSFLLDR